MLSLKEEMTRLFFVLNPPLEDGSCVSIQFIGSSKDDGVSTIAREFALTASRNIKGNILLLDLSLERENQYDQLKSEEAATRFGQPSESMSLDGPKGEDWESLSTLWTQNPETPIFELTEPLTTFHQLGDSHMYVTNLDTEKIKRNGQPRLNSSEEYWKSLCRMFHMIVIDSPPPSESFDGLAICKFLDATVLVLAAEKTRRPVAVNLRDKVLDNDGHVAGIVFNKRRMHIPQFIYRML